MRRCSLALVGVMTVGCGLLPPDPPEWVTNRLPLAACGTETVRHGDGMDPAARACLLEAYQEGRGAELISDAVTVEGDPIRHYLRVHENGTVEIFVDATRDRFGSLQWRRVRCEALEPAGDAVLVFIEAGCEDLPLP